MTSGKTELFKGGTRTSRVVLVYADDGCSEVSTKACVNWLKSFGVSASSIRMVTSDNVISELNSNCAKQTAFLVPGGEDLKFLAKLDDGKLESIKRFVHAGVSYIGICAGAYFASSFIIFDPSNGLCAIRDMRPLSLFPGRAQGPVRSGFAYNSERGFSAEILQCVWDNSEFSASAYCNGGPCWDIQEGEALIIAKYEEPVRRLSPLSTENPAAVLAASYGVGRVVLSGVHPELSTPPSTNFKDCRMLSLAILKAADIWPNF